jgi:hypothetical protein
VALKPTTIKRIQEAVRRFRNYLKFSQIGPHALSQAELKDLVRAGYIGADTKFQAAIQEAYIAAHLDQSDTPGGAPKTIRDAGQAYLERMAALYADKSAQELGSDVMATVETHLLPFIDRNEGKIVYETLADAKNRGKYLGNILKDKVKNWEHRWRTITRTEMYRAANLGSADAAIANNPGKSPDEIYVYKVTARDNNVCKKCKEFWLMPDGVTPRVFRLSTLMQNATNIGLKTADHKPCLEPAHPNCRCFLLNLKQGFGFRNGELTFIDLDYSEYEIQRSIK